MAVMDIDMFAWDSKTKCLCSEMSTIHGNNGIENDRVKVQGQKLVHPVEFQVVEQDWNEENELVSWRLAPVEASLAVTGLHMILFND